MKPAKIILRNGRDRAQAARWLDKCPLGYTLWFKPPVRTNVASAYMWALLDDVAAQKEWDGRKRTSDEWKDLFSACLRQQEIVRGLEGGIDSLECRGRLGSCVPFVFRRAVGDAGPGDGRHRAH